MQENKVKSKTPEYVAWYNIQVRCFNPKHNSYKNYGERGITISKEWKESFEVFLNDMGYRPGDNYSIDRIDTNGNYCKENCKWSTIKEQQVNRTNSIKVINTETNEIFDSIDDAARSINTYPSSLGGKLRRNKNNYPFEYYNKDKSI